MNERGAIDNPVHLFSFGGGVQSTAALVLAAQGRIRVDAFFFSNVGADSENPATLDYLAQHARPYAARYGLPFFEVQATLKRQPDTLMSAIERRQGSVVIPVLVQGSGVSSRTCTVDYKVRVINRAVKAAYAGQYVRMGIGFSVDEWTRARDTAWHDRWSETAKRPELYGFHRQNWYPLLELGLSRIDCHRVITDAGLPTPPKSSCFFCPYHRRGEWVEMKQREPELFERACRIDELLAERHLRLQGKPAFIHPDRKPLRDAVGDQQHFFSAIDDADIGACDTGHCMT